jgi:pimeloyl-ACP methyl ester carboxylesterase
MCGERLQTVDPFRRRRGNMQSHEIVGGGGARLHVVEAGNASGRPILFIHGFSQSWRAWSRQLDSGLAQRHRLVAMDLRGHGLSDRPREAYGESLLWADDVRAVIDALHLEQPVLSGWSYGPLVGLDYIRHYGDDDIGGLHFVGGVSKLGSAAAMSVLTPEFVALVPAFFAIDPDESARGLAALLGLCFARAPADSDLNLMLGISLGVPPHVRQAMLSRAIDNDDVMSRLRKPVLITHGDRDRVVKPLAAEQHKASLAEAQLHLMPGAGHACFWDDAAGFNRRLAEFCETLS